ncbi:MAG: hypothetical protein ACR2IS_15285 [Nitrososphaeraceae archaeon]
MSKEGAALNLASASDTNYFSVSKYGLATVKGIKSVKREGIC